MKTASVGLASHLAGTLTTLATCWKVTRLDGQVFGFTDHNENLVVSGVTYAAATGYQRAAIGSRADMSVDETELSGLLDSDAITTEEVRAGLWDHAEVRIFAVNWADVSHGQLKLRRGRLGEVIVQDDGTFKAELRGLTQALQQTVGEMYSAECRADYGDSRCKQPVRPALIARSTAYALGDFVRVQTDGAATGSYQEECRIYECTTAGSTAASAPTFDTAVAATTTDGTVVWTAREALTRPATVESAPDRETVVLVADGIEAYADSRFALGVLTVETGANAGISRDVVAWDQSTRTLTLFLPFAYPLEAGAVVRVQPGCDKRLVTCNLFDNRLNFRGEPHVPGLNALIDTPL
jgi:hypothetical protein